jgi:hypothetical protein
MLIDSHCNVSVDSGTAMASGLTTSGKIVTWSPASKTDSSSGITGTEAD